MIDECVRSSHAESAGLRGRRLAFFSASTGEIFAGDSAILADVIEAAYFAGAEVICWSPAGAALRRELGARKIAIQHRDWPPEPDRTPAGPTPAPPVEAPAGKPSPVSRLWRGITPRSVRLLAGFLSETRRFRKELETVQPELCIFNLTGAEGTAVAGGMWSRERCWSILHVSTPATKGLLARAIQWGMETVTLWSCAMVVHVSAAVRDEWSRRCFYPQARTRVIYNGVTEPGGPDPARGPEVLRAELGIGPDDFVFCVPARLAAMKGHSYLLDAIALDPEKFRHAKVLLCGDGDLMDEIRERTRKPPFCGIVQMLGFRTDILDVMRASDCVALPSIAAENFSVAALQAMMLARPVIATAIGGMAEAVLDEKTGIVAPPRSAEALAKAMIRLMSDRDGSRRLGNYAREYALKNFTRQQMMTQYEEFISRYLGRQLRTSD
jgi:glycosyltransferase involved in cell wall biosynthesis